MSEPTMDKAILSGLIIVFLVALWIFRDQQTIGASILSVITAIVGGLLGLMRGSRAQQTNEIQNSTVNQPVVEKQ
jgi:hypothetical protein